MRRRALPLLLTLSVVVAFGCGRDSSSGAESSQQRTLRVFAATSLTEVFTDAADDFERANESADVEFTFAASSSLARQLADGAPADVFASADSQTMDAVVAATDATDPVVFAHNRLALIVEPGNPRGLKAVADLEHADVTYVTCAEAVPCGRYARLALDKARVMRAPRSFEENAKAVVARVALGEADAGIGFATDARAAAGDVDTVDDPLFDGADLEAAYPMAVVSATEQTELARAWIRFFTGSEGQSLLLAHGFTLPAGN